MLHRDLFEVKALLLVVFVPSLLHNTCAYAAPARIAVIGGGIGGAFTAAFLRQELGSSVEIDVYDFRLCCAADEPDRKPESGVILIVEIFRFEKQAVGGRTQATQVANEVRASLPFDPVYWHRWSLRTRRRVTDVSV